MLFFTCLSHVARCIVLRRLLLVAVYHLNLLIKGSQDVCMFPLNYMNTEVAVEKRRMLSTGSSLGDAGIQRSVLIDYDESYGE